MSKRQFMLGTFVLITVLGFGGVFGYFYNQGLQIKAEKAVKIMEVEKEREKTIQKEQTNRTKERVRFWNNLPFVGDD